MEDKVGDGFLERSWLSMLMGSLWRSLEEQLGKKVTRDRKEQVRVRHWLGLGRWVSHERTRWTSMVMPCVWSPTIYTS